MKRTIDSYGDETDDDESDNHSGAVDGEDEHPDSNATTAPAAAAASNSTALSVDDYKQRCRELNRISKIRCRKRRKDRVRELEATIANLSSEHQSLQTENAQLRQEFAECSTTEQPRSVAVAQLPLFHEANQSLTASPASSSIAQLHFPNGLNGVTPAWDTNQLAWLRAQQQQKQQQQLLLLQQQLLQQQQQVVVPTPSQQLLTVPSPSQQLLALGALPQDNQRFDPRLIPFLASLQSNEVSNMVHHSNGNLVQSTAQQNHVYNQAQIPTANAVSEWLCSQLLLNHQQHATTSQQQLTFQPSVPERHYEAGSEHSSEDSESKYNASV